MATFGNTTTPATINWFDVTGDKEFWCAAQFSMPGGVATDMKIFVGGYSMTANAQAVIWDSSGNVFWASALQSIGNGETWCDFTIPNVYLPAGNYLLGFYSPDHVQWKTEATGGVHMRTGVTSPQAANTSNDEYSGGGYGDLGVYVTYTPGNAYIWNGSAWVAGGLPSVLTAAPSTYTAGVPFVWNGSSWVQGA